MIDHNIGRLKSDLSSLRRGNHIDMKMEEFLDDLIRVLEALNRKVEENEKRFDTFQ